ncbi:hypothetical protein [Amycolatopsis sp. GA6-003]|uniref:hypothetical protein n=1 Tax=Amycolatopsis sp. GA6-003 TaxID=2652444 RepID=UPI003916DC96
MDKPAPNSALLVIIAVLLGVIAALIAGILATSNGGTTATAIISGGAGFGSTVSLTLFIMKSLRVL